MSDRAAPGSLASFRPFRARIAAIAVLSVLAAQAEAVALVLIAPVGLAVAAGETVADTDLGPLHLDGEVTGLIALALVAVAVAAAVTLVAALLRARMVAGWEREERDGFIDEFLDADLPTQITTRSSDLQVSFSAYVGRGGLALGALTTALKAAASIVIYLGVSLLIDVRGTLLLVVIGGAFFAALRPVNRVLRRTSTSMSQVGLSYAERVGEVTAAVRDVRVFDAFDVFRHRLKALSADGEQLHRRAAFLSAITTPIYQYLGLALTLGILFAAVRADGLDMAAVAAVALLLLRSLGYGQQLQNAYQLMVESLPYFERASAIRRTYQRHQEADGTLELGPIERVELRSVEHTYDDGTPGLRGVDLVLGRGEVVGIVGPSGSGKSTLAQVLLRMRVPTAGDYLLDGRDAHTFTRASFYRRVTLVPQRCELLHDTATENIRMYDPTADLAAVEAAARRASLHEVLAALPDGYDTVLGESGRELSGGQAQRLAIARALLRHADVIVLDEPTSALDVHAEADVQAAIGALAEDRAVVVIAHRLSTLSICDRIVVLRDGRVEAEGTPDELRATSPFFARAVATGALDGAEPAVEQLAEHRPDPGDGPVTGTAGGVADPLS